MKFQNKKIYLVALTTALLASCTHKADKKEEAARMPNSLMSFCRDYAKIQEESESCDDNDKFVDAAENCLIKFEKGIRAAGIKISTPDDATRYDKEGGNDSALDPTSSGSENTTDAWIVKAHQAVSELKVYTEQLNYPEDAEEEEEHGHDPEEIADDVACYGETKKSITDVADDFQYYLEQLEDLKKSQ